MDALRIAALLVTLALGGAPAQHGRAHAHVARTAPVAYSGIGAWVDRYDFHHLEDPESAVAYMADHGVKTLYVETASWKVPASVDVVAPAQTDDLLAAAHANGMSVVAWYLPGFIDLETDMRRIRAALAFRTEDGQSFDSFALDVEANAVSPVWRRNARLLRLSRKIRRAVGPGYPLGAIVPDQLSTSRGNVLWPGFPYASVAKYYDVFLPMAYSTLNRARGAARDSGAIGASLYKYPLYNPGSWAALSSFGAGRP